MPDQIAYVGDSRVIAGSQSIQGGMLRCVPFFITTGAKKLSVHELSSDHKPQNPEERRRINKHGGDGIFVSYRLLHLGEVRKLEGDIPHRVFCKGRSVIFGYNLRSHQTISWTCDESSSW